MQTTQILVEVLLIFRKGQRVKMRVFVVSLNFGFSIGDVEIA